MKRWISSLLILLVALPMFVLSCKAISSVFDRQGKVIARVGTYKLTQQEVRAILPPGTSPEDSLRIVMRYINNWASDLIYASIAEEQLSKQEKDVTAELEAYRKALLKYRYEQRYVNERLDTNITPDEIEAYYDSHKQTFTATVPMVKARFMRIASDSPDIEIIRKKLSTGKVDDILYADSLGMIAADRYTGYNNKWIKITDLARDFGKDYTNLLPLMKNQFITVQDRDYGKVNMAYIPEYIAEGQQLPLEWCEPEIKTILIGVRRHKLVSSLEQELLDDARATGKLIIY